LLRRTDHAESAANSAKIIDFASNHTKSAAKLAIFGFFWYKAMNDMYFLHVHL
jgi:hypothetical protein